MNDILADIIEYFRMFLYGSGLKFDSAVHSLQFFQFLLDFLHVTGKICESAASQISHLVQYQLIDVVCKAFELVVTRHISAIFRDVALDLTIATHGFENIEERPPFRLFAVRLVEGEVCTKVPTQDLCFFSAIVYSISIGFYVEAYIRVLTIWRKT